MNEKITVSQCKFLVPNYNSELHGSREDYQAALNQAARDLVQPEEKQTAALLSFAESEVYQESKRAALQDGDYMTPELRSILCKQLKQRPAFASDSITKIYERWLAGFMKGVPATEKYLADAKAVLAVQQGLAEVETVDEGF